jgi:hypothetical protein
MIVGVFLIFCVLVSSYMGIVQIVNALGPGYITSERFLPKALIITGTLMGVGLW